MATTPYEFVAHIFVRLAKEAWASEEAMQQTAEALGMTMFDRTKSARVFTKKLLDRAEKEAFPEGRPSSMSGNHYDAQAVALAFARICDDYTLTTQVLPNLLAVPFLLYVQDMEKDIEASKAVLASHGAPDPLAPKAKKVAADATNAAWAPAYNHILALTKAMNPGEPLTMVVHDSFRLTHAGSTPAFADSMGLCGHSPTLDRYMKPVSPQLATVYLSWAPDHAASQVLGHTKETPEGPVFYGVGPIVSRSGGDILAASVFSRKVAHEAWKAIAEFPWKDAGIASDPTPPEVLYVMPRLYSTTICVPTAFKEKALDVLTAWAVSYGVTVGDQRIQA
jgi:hypothetical protein